MRLKSSHFHSFIQCVALHLAGRKYLCCASLSVSFLTEKDIGRVPLQQLVGILSHTWNVMLYYMPLVKYIAI